MPPEVQGMMAHRITGRTLLVLSLLVSAAASAGCGRTLREFPIELAAERTGAIDAASFPPSYLGGRIAKIDADASGSIYVGTQPPCQLMRLSPAGDVVWIRRGDENGREPFKGLGLEVSLSGDRLLVVDSGARRVRVFDLSGNETGELAVQAAFEAAGSTTGAIFVYPSKDGFLLDVFDAQLRYLSSIVPVPGAAEDVRSASLNLRPDSDGGVFALWNPSRIFYHLGPGGEKKSEFELDPPDLVSNLKQRLERAQAIGRSRGFEVTVAPFLDMTVDGEGNLAALYLFEEPAGVETSASPGGEGSAEPRPEPVVDAGALYRFTPDGRALHVVRGLGAVSRVAFEPDGEILALDWKANTILRFRTRETVASLPAGTFIRP